MSTATKGECEIQPNSLRKKPLAAFSHPRRRTSRHGQKCKRCEGNLEHGDVME